MDESTPTGPARRWLRRLLDAVDHSAFRDPDLDAVARGWTVRRERRFVRTYRDPRWDSVTACPVCACRRTVGAACESCGAEPAERTAPAGSVGAS